MAPTPHRSSYRGAGPRLRSFHSPWAWPQLSREEQTPRQGVTWGPLGLGITPTRKLEAR